MNKISLFPAATLIVLVLSVVLTGCPVTPDSQDGGTASDTEAIEERNELFVSLPNPPHPAGTSQAAPNRLLAARCVASAGVAARITSSYHPTVTCAESPRPASYIAVRTRSNCLSAANSSSEAEPPCLRWAWRR